AVAIDNAHFHALIDCRLSRIDHLLDERVVNGLRIADNRDGCVGKHRVAFESEEKLGISTDLRKAVCRSAHLAGGRIVGKLEWVSPNDGGQTSSRFVVRRQIKREREILAIRSFVFDELFCNAAKLW